MLQQVGNLLSILVPDFPLTAKELLLWMQQSFQGLGWADGEPGSGRHRGRRALEAGTRLGAALAELQPPL